MKFKAVIIDPKRVEMRIKANFPRKINEAAKLLPATGTLPENGGSSFSFLEPS